MKKSTQMDLQVSRRGALGGSASLAAASLLSGQASAANRSASARPVLVQVFLRGAMDGLTTVVPYADTNLYNLRPTIAVQPPGPPSGARDLDGFFGLAPTAAPLLTPYGNGHLAIVHATGSIDPSRSHFEAEARMEIADPNVPAGVLTTGWISRYLALTAGLATGPLRGVGASNLLPYSLRGAPKAVPIPDFADFLFPGRVVTASERQAAIVAAYARRGAPVGTAALETLDAFGLGGIDFTGYTPENGASYPDTQLGQRMKNIAALIKGAIGVEVVTIDVPGWDLHAQLGPVDGHMAGLLSELTNAIEAFYLDLLGHLDDYVLVVLSEFGRHARENGSAGTDHGHGNAMFVMGGHVNGGQVFADWPSLGPGFLDSGDLAITIDYRDILGEILRERLGIADPSPIFPLHTFTTYGVTA